jgi:hypothetical protein
MQRPRRQFVSAFLPLIPLAFCHGCGGGGGGAGATPVTQAPAPAPAPTPVTTPASLNSAPSITIVPEDTVRVGATYTLLPVASDPEGDVLRFSAASLPTWASLDPATGRITGTPGESDEGIYESITITVADATHSIVTPPFSITVINDVVPESGSGVAALQWETPPSKVDGSPLDDLAGYRILYGHDSADLDQSVFISDPSVTSYQFSTLETGTWYFAVVAVNASGLEGPPTTVASKSI